MSDAESLFTYGLDESAANYSFPDHVPPFLDEILSNLTSNSTLVDVCGDNVECLFDFGQTGDADVGMAAMMVENQTASEMQDVCKIIVIALNNGQGNYCFCSPKPSYLGEKLLQ